MTASAGASYSTVSYQQQYGACPQTAEGGDFEDNPVVIVAPVSYHQRHRQRSVRHLMFVALFLRFRRPHMLLYVS